MGLSKKLLGFIAGATILLGPPVARLRRPAPTLRAMLNAVAVGILLFLVWDVLSERWEPIHQAVGRVHDHEGGLGAAVGYGSLFACGLVVGLGSLVVYDARMSRQASAPPSGAARYGPGAMSAAEGATLAARWWKVSAWSPAQRLALMIAIGIGLHNFAEDLRSGSQRLATRSP